jgi:membrane associated rhomboid family serine protease
MGAYSSSRIRFDWHRHFTPAVRGLIVANCGVFVAMKLASLAFGPEGERKLIEWFGLMPFGVVHGLRFWQLATYLFLHAGVWHLLMNMLTLWFFGPDLERVWGTRRFLTYYFVTGIGAAACVVLVNVIPEWLGHEPRLSVTIGASGALFGILMACAILFPDRQVWLIPFPIMLPMRMFVLLWGAIAFFSSLEGASDGVSHIAHLGGLLVGYLYLRRGSLFFTVRNRYSDWTQRRLRRKFEVYQREHRDEPPSNPSRWVH